MLDLLAHSTIAYLVLAGLGSFFGGCLLVARLIAGSSPTGLSEVVVAALLGFSGSAVAALTSCLDRYAVGFEREDGKPYPKSAKAGLGKFNRRFARWLLVRPFLGAIIAPVFVWGISHFVSSPKQWIETFGFTAFMGGLLAKSVVDLIKRLFKNVFQA
ncbi:MAG: hypothetical protein WBE41_17405 [Terracidiphilus sp.]